MVYVFQRWKTMEHQFLQIQAQVKELRDDNDNSTERSDSDDDGSWEDPTVPAEWAITNTTTTKDATHSQRPPVNTNPPDDD